jgi:predicted RNA-binding protein with RPS1 domain
VEILSIDLERKRIGVSIMGAGEERQEHENAEYQNREPIEGFGSLAEKLRAAMRPPKD